MTVSSLVTAVVVGVVLGLLGRRLVPAGRGLPFWMPLTVAVGAAVFATVIARLAGITAAGLSPVELIMQIVFAVAAVSIVARTADRRPPDRRYPSGTTR